MSAPPVTTLDAFHAAVLQRLASVYGERIATYAPYDPAQLLDPQQPLVTPALYLQIEGIEPHDTDTRKPQRGRCPLRLALALHLILSTQTQGDLQVALDVLASSLLVLLRAADPDPRLAAYPGERWGLGAAAAAPEQLAALPADWQPGLNGYDSRVVRWEQVLQLSADPVAVLGEPDPEPAPDPDEPEPEPEGE